MGWDASLRSSYKSFNNGIPKIIETLIKENLIVEINKGLKVSYRMVRQLRQPVLLAASRSMVSVSPQEGYLHPKSELDTLDTISLNPLVK